MQKYIYYRWDGPSLGDVDDSRSVQAKNIQNVINTNFPGKEEIIKVTPVKIKINSEGKREITNRQYLDASMGVGGHIIGFLNYNAGQEPTPTFNYTSFSSSQYAFRMTPKYLYLLTGVSFPDSIKSITYHVSNSELDNIVKYCPGKLKFDKLGSLMPDSSANTAEVNFVGKVDLDGYRIDFGDIPTASASSSQARSSEDDDSSAEESSSEGTAPPANRSALFIPNRPSPAKIRRTGGQLKRGREESGVPTDFSKVLDVIVTSEGISGFIHEEKTISAEECEPRGGKRKTRKFKIKRRKTRKSNKRG